MYRNRQELDCRWRFPQALAMKKRDLVFRGLKQGDFGWLVQMHGELNARDEDFDITFEAPVAQILADFVRHHDPAFERGWIVERNGQRLGSIFCTREDGTVARLRLFLLLPETRGFGFGRSMLLHCMDFARSKGYRRMVLWTHKSHEAACALYRKTGFRLMDEAEGREFGVDVVSQNWEIHL